MPIKYSKGKFTTLDGKELTIKEAVCWSDTARAKRIANEYDQDKLGDNIKKTLWLLENTYTILNCDAYISSFFRTPALNTSVGGKIVPPSAHMDGRAVDSTPIGKRVEDCFSILQEHALELQYDQLIIEKDKKGNIWLHESVSKMKTAPRLQAFSLNKDADTTRVAK